MSEHRNTTCQKNDLPKSLQGAEDADIVWGMITERFPNAAPLLCEMEAVIDRAEDLLQQLRAPCQREIETSTSFCTPDSEESTLMISARGSLSTENDVRIRGKCQSCKEAATVGKKGNEDAERRIENDIADEREESCIVLHRQGRCTDVDNVDDSMIDIDSDQNARSQGSIETKDDALNVSFQGSGDESLSKFTGQKKPLNIFEAYSKRCKVPIMYQYITEGPHRHKSNVVVIRGSLAEFATTARGESEKSAKNSLAATILRMIANHQMNDGEFSTLLRLSDEEMLEIIRFGTVSPRETAQRKLYQICLEMKQPVPKYCVDKDQTNEGYTYVASCTALGHTGKGRGFRECVAKKSAADELYRQLYCSDKK
ncbi:uncharacterized protein LOC122404755 [Colletes gigas]|uniref:uncharacterized protein LOC122404755 n=1 Tax=Colletes gigas TaxID=935657 RepID=UPI001C9A3958|nr:uncharacterized protein LOC122404755 [Colletes gigas]